MNDGSLWNFFLFGVGGIDREFYIVFFFYFFILSFFSVWNRMLLVVRHGRNAGCRDICYHTGDGCYHTGEGWYNNTTLKRATTTLEMAGTTPR